MNFETKVEKCAIKGVRWLDCIPKSIMMVLLFFTAALTAETTVRKPEFGEVLPNITVAVGRDATLPCVVKHLQDYKVSCNNVAHFSYGNPVTYIKTVLYPFPYSRRSGYSK